MNSRPRQRRHDGGARLSARLCAFLISRVRAVRGTAERGNAALIVVVLFAVMLAAVGLVVDGGATIAAQQQANAVAAEAARTAGQVVATDAVLQGQPSAAQGAAAISAGTSYLSQAGASGSVQLTNSGTTITATASVTTTPVIMTIIGVGPQTVTGTAEVRLAQDTPGG